MMKVKYYKCPSCGRKFKTLTGWGEHMETLHPDEMPEGYSISRYFYYTMTGKTHGTCRTCKKDTDWNEESQKYNQYCNNPACKQAYVKIAHQRMINQYGKVHLLDDPDMQRKMVQGRKISGKYRMSDGGSIGYTGSYEKKFLEMLDAMFDWPSADIIGPSPHTYYYEYNNEKDPDIQHAKKFYIPDFFIPSLNLEVEIEQTTSGNKKMTDVYAVKKEQKKAIMEKNKHVNFVTVSDNDFTPFFDFLMKVKEMIPEKKDMSDFVMESTYGNINNGEIVMEGEKYNPDDDDDVIKSIKDWAEENDVTLKISKEGDWGLNAFRRGGDTLFLVGNCPNVRMVLKGLKGAIDATKYKITLDNYNTIFLTRKKSVATESMNTVSESYLLNKSDIYHNKDKFDSGEINLCFITGLSGSGKSTMGRNMSSDNIEHYELDDVILNKESYTMNELREYGGLIYNFFNTIGKKYYYTMEDVVSGKAKSIGDDYDEKIINDFVKYSMSYARSHPNTKFIIEGIWLYRFISPKILEKHSVYIKGTSALTSSRWGSKRNIKNDELESGKRVPLKSRASMIKKQYIACFKDESKLKQFRDHFSKSIAMDSYQRFSDFTFLDIFENRNEVIRRLKSKEPAYVKNIDDYDGEIVLHNDKVVGQVFVGNEKTKDKGFITGLWVEKSYRKIGLGARLLDDAVKTYGGIDLTVLKGNKAAIALYEKYGFGFTGYVNDKREIETDYHKQKMMYMKLKSTPETGLLPAIEEANYSKDNCYPVYIVLMHSGTLLANIIQKFTNDEFSHACISFNSNLSPMYSFGNKKVGGVDAGFTIQSPASEFFSTKKAYYKVYVMYVNRDAYQKMRENLDKFLHDRLKLKYDLFSLLKVWRGKPSEESKKFFCSRFVMQVIGAGRPLEKVASLYKPQDIAELNDISCVNQGDDFSKYDYHITEKNLKKVQRKQFDSVAFESLLYDNDDFQDIALEGFFSFMKKDNDESVAHWKDKLFGPRELMKRELGHAKSKKFGPFIDVINGFIIIRGINYNLLKIRIKDFYKDRNVYNIFLPIYDALSYRKFEKKRIQRADIKIDYLETPVFFALELTKLFSELGEWYNDRRYMTMANLIYKRTWLKEADENSERVSPLSTSRLGDILKYKLLDYQEDFIKQYPILKAQLNLKGYCLAFEQGLGKTFTAVSLAECLGVDHVYIVCPNTSDMPQVWKREIKKYIRRYDDIDTFLSEVMICTDKGALESPKTKYYIVNNESISKMLPYVKSGKNMLILDESHNFRNIKGKRTLELIELQEKLKATDTLCMSGTPVKGTPNEICPVLRLIDPTFTNKVAEIYNHAFNVHHEIALSLVKSRFGRIMMRETKAVLGKSLPPKEYKDLELQVSNSSQYTMSTVASLVAERYSELFHSGLKEATKLKDEFYQFIAEYMPKSYNRMQFNRLVELTALAEVMPELHEVDLDFLNSAIRDTASNIKDRQKAKRFDYIVKNYLRYNLHCRGVAFGEIMPKKRNSVFIELFEQNKELIFKMIQENPTKTIIFSQFRKVCNYIHNALIDAGIGAVLITGEVGDRMSIVDAFKDNDALTVMVATPKTLGVGVTLTEASQVFFFGPPWRNTDYDQCADRVHRIGQTRQVTIYNVLLDTGEELNLTGRMSDILEWSKSMVSEMVDSSLNKTTEDQFADEILSANESATNLDEIKEFLDQVNETPIVTGRVLPKRFLSSILTVTRYFANEDLTTSVALPEGIIIDDRAMWWDESDEMTFANLRWSPYASAVFASIADSGKKANVAFVKIVDDGIPHWQLVTLKKIKAGSKLTYHPHTSDMSFDKDLR